jgi:hypothetical protein
VCCAPQPRSSLSAPGAADITSAVLAFAANRISLERSRWRERVTVNRPRPARAAGQPYQWFRVIENALQAKLTPAKAEALQAELADIDRATMTVPTRHSDLYFMLRYHLDQTRSRLIEASRDITMAQMSETNGQ